MTSLSQINYATLYSQITTYVAHVKTSVIIDSLYIMFGSKTLHSSTCRRLPVDGLY